MSDVCAHTSQILQYILIPMFSYTFEEGQGDALLGGSPDPEHDNEENIISVFINKVINPDKPFGSSVSEVGLGVSGKPGRMMCGL